MDWKDFENESISDLVEFMQMDDEKYAKAAFFAFCFNLREVVITKCEIVCKMNGFTADNAVELAHRTFQRFLKYPKYDHEKSNCDDFDEGVVIYLYGIAKRELLSMKYAIDSPYDGTEEILYGFPDIDSSLSNERKKTIKETREIIEKALSKLSEKHRIIFYTYITHSKDGFKLPRTLLASLRKELDLAQPTIRYYKKEAYDKVNEYLEIYAKK